MRKMSTILVMVLISSTVFATELLKLEKYNCGLQVGKSLAILASTSVYQEAVNLSEDIESYSTQAKLSKTLKKKAERAQAAQAANSSWQSILYSIEQINAVSADEATTIKTACDLQID